ncbi:BTAD domain-containing putative transcriptional regulator [Microbispora catharanthi]|uniref:BTAD domain-containing putative transcriptional regulator n=1 Tax=Microbispora catharanthi TaxID=1712871 RepID=UPI001F0EB1DF|nr:BTAD domain-containing putative transcriptional regulator [Microbispora catharanthi]
MQGDTPGAGTSFAVLGPLDVRRDGRPVEVGGQRLRALLTQRGAPLTDLPNAEVEVARLEELRIAAAEDRIEAELALGRHADPISEPRLLVTAHPLRERPHGQLMRALYVAGRRAEALAAYEEARSVFADRLGADPSPALAELRLAMLRGELSEEGTRPPPAVTPTGPARSEQALARKEQALARMDRPPPRAPRRGDLRARLTSFVGRDDDVGRIGGLLAADRLVTLLGPGGAGKTRLAVESAEAIAARVPDGVWLVEFAPVGDAAEVPRAALTALGLRDTGLVPVRAVPAMPSAPGGESDQVTRLVSALAARDTLIMLDNCEHVVEPAAVLADRLLAECPGLRILATSRDRSASPESGCGRSGRTVPVPPCGCSPSGRPPYGDVPPPDAPRGRGVELGPARRRRARARGAAGGVRGRGHAGGRPAPPRGDRGAGHVDVLRPAGGGGVPAGAAARTSGRLGGRLRPYLPRPPVLQRGPFRGGRGRPGARARRVQDGRRPVGGGAHCGRTAIDSAESVTSTVMCGLFSCGS